MEKKDLLRTLTSDSSFLHLLEKLRSLPEQMQVSISETAKLTGISQAKIRNWTQSGILLPEKDKSAEKRTIRYYTLQDLRRLVIAAALKKKCSLSEIAKLFQEPSVDQIIDQWLTSTTVEWNAERSISSLNQIARGLAQILYLLVLDPEVRPNTGIVIPLSANSLPSTDSLQDLLPNLEESLVIWATSQRQLAVFLQPMIRFESTAYQLFSLPIPAPKGKPQIVYRLVEPDTPLPHVEEMDEETTALLLNFIPLLQEIVDSPGRTPPFSGIPSGGPPALALLARMMKQLGPEHWSYVAIFQAERDPIPRYRQRLVLRAEAGKSPFNLEESVPADSGLVGWTYRTAQPVNKGTLTDLDDRVTSEGRGGVASLLAIPIIAGSVNTPPHGVVVLGSTKENAFSSTDEHTLFLLVDLLGGLLAQEEVATQTRDYFLASLGQPPLKETLFGPFKGRDWLTAQMTSQIRKIREAKEGEREHSISLFLVDVDRADGIEERYGYSVLREVTFQVGEIVAGQRERIAEDLRKEGGNVSPVSRTLTDRYAIFATDVPVELLYELGRRIMTAVNLKNFSVTKVASFPISVTVRVGITWLEAAEVCEVRLMPEELTELIIGKARRALAEGARQGGNNICYADSLDSECKL
jgi:DNA-binding transcriptional MerR regulator/GGDEF domain-containing protein